MGLYRLIHVRDGAEIGRYMFEPPETTNNSFATINIAYPLSGLTTYESYTQRAFTNSGGVLRSFSNKQLLIYNSSTEVGSSLINGLTGFKNIRVSVADFAIGDRLYVGRWDAKHSYFQVTGKQDNGVIMAGYTPSGVLAYSGIGWTTGGSSIQTNCYTFPWLYAPGDETSYRLSYVQISLDTRDNGLYGAIWAGNAPTNLANGAAFWGNVKSLDNIIADPDNPIGGGGFIPDLEGDDIELPGAPDETVSGVLASGFLNIYKPTDADLRAFGAALWTNAFNVKWSDIDSVSNLILNAVSNPIDFIIGLFMLPVTPSVGASSGIYLGGINVNTISAPRVSSQYVTIDFGTLDISELYGNYLDYANSRLSIYLPYVGTADIDVQEINGGSVHLQYIVDVFTGACVANVHCVKVTTTPWGESYQNKTVHSYSGNMAIQLPISAGSFDTLTQGLINVGLGLGTNTPAIAMTGAKDVVQGFAGDVTTRGSLSSNTGKLGYQTPYLMFTRPIESRPANLGALHGFSAGVGGILSQFSGYVVCSDVKLDGVTATDSELNEIESILKSGVYV